MRTRLHARRSVRATVLAAVAGTAVACGGADTPDTPETPAPESSRLAGEELWLNPEGHGPAAVQQALAEGQTADAEALAPLAEQPADCPDGCCGSGSYELGVPEEEGLTPNGWYMLVVVDEKGVPSPARWVHVG